MYPINLPCVLLLFCERFLPGSSDRLAVRSGYCGSGYGSPLRVLVFVGSGYNDPTVSEQTPNAPRMGKGAKGGNSC